MSSFGILQKVISDYYNVVFYDQAIPIFCCLVRAESKDDAYDKGVGKFEYHKIYRSNYQYDVYVSKVEQCNYTCTFVTGFIDRE
jgi:hypothetical protein